MTGAVSNSFALLAGYNYKFAEDMSVKFMYSYDIPISGSVMGTGGAHEINIALEFSNVQIFGRTSSMSRYGGRKGYDYLDCPAFY